jgi:two-component system, chemotaxis family, response regulator WspF
MRIAIVNDVSLAREVLRRALLSVPGHSIAWIAENGAEAVSKAVHDRPDVILMDLIMPVMDGVEATRRIMTHNPCPILLVTSSVSGNLSKVYEAMGHGGLDAVNTPTLGSDGKIKDAEGMLARIAKLARSRTVPTCLPPVAVPPSDPRSPGGHPPLVLMGASTGGPEALAQVLGALPSSFPAAVVLVQHIAADFAPKLAEWLQGRSRLPVQIAQGGVELRPGVVVLACSDDHLILRPDRRLGYVADPIDHPYRPSVDVLFNSAAACWPRPGLAVLLTGMGGDGANGLAQLRRGGWYTIAQDQASCVVYGMPKTAVEQNAACVVLPLSEIAAALQTRLSRT